MTDSATPDTEALLNRVAGGHAGAQSLLLARHRTRLRKMIELRLDRRLWRRLDPSDVLQEALCDAALKLPQFVCERPVPFYPWLRRLTWEHLVRLHQMHVRAQRRSIAREVSIPLLPDESAAELADRLAVSTLPPEHRLVKAELKSRVLAGLSELPERDREILVLRYLEHLSNAEIAASLMCSEGSVRTRHTRALARLAHHVDPDLMD